VREVLECGFETRRDTRALSTAPKKYQPGTPAPRSCPSAQGPGPSAGGVPCRGRRAPGACSWGFGGDLGRGRVVDAMSMRCGEGEVAMTEVG
jgi:hypothetical protein